MIWTITDNRGGKTRTVGYRRAVARAWRLSLDGRSVFVGRWKPGRRLDFIAGPTFRYGRRDDVVADWPQEAA